jgi:hypothetical protein
MEETSPILGYPGYCITRTGVVFSTRNWGGGVLRPMRLTPQKKGHLRVQLQVEGRPQSILVHRLVLLTFVGPPPADHPVARHLNGQPTDNRVENLAWGTYQDNSDDMITHQTRATGSRVGSSKLVEADVVRIRKLRPSMSVTALAAMFGVNSGTISRACTGDKWAHLPGALSKRQFFIRR